MSEGTPVRADIVFTGRVQGVFFRKTAERVAAGFSVTGWVRNEPDGSVRCVVEGSEDAVRRFAAAVAGAKCGNVDEIAVTMAIATGEFAGFQIRR